jgi:hypothetical protein
MTTRIPHAVYSKLALDCSAALLRAIDPNLIAKAGWEQFIADVFDLTDSLAAELERRLEARQPKEDQP